MTTKAIGAGARAALLPCPFCNSRCVTSTHNEYGWKIVQCDDCGACGPCLELEGDMHVDRWNDRAALASGELVPASAVAEMREQLKVALACAESAEHGRDKFRRAVAAERERCAKVADDHTPVKFDGTLAAHVTGKTIAAAIRALEPASGEYVLGWRDISTAPKDGTDIIAYRPLAHLTNDPHFIITKTTSCSRASPQGVEHYTTHWCHPTHWMPLPEPPPMLTAAPSNGSGK